MSSTVTGALTRSAQLAVSRCRVSVRSRTGSSLVTVAAKEVRLPAGVSSFGATVSPAGMSTTRAAIDMILRAIYSILTIMGCDQVSGCPEPSCSASVSPSSICSILQDQSGCDGSQGSSSWGRRSHPFQRPGLRFRYVTIQQASDLGLKLSAFEWELAVTTSQRLIGEGI